MLFAIVTVLMVVSLIVDGWSQHRMLAVNGGKGIEITTIYGKNPTYLRYYVINIPVFLFFLTDVALLHFWAHVHWYGYTSVGLFYCGAHWYGYYLNQKYF